MGSPLRYLKSSGKSALFVVFVVVAGEVALAVACGFARIANMSVSDWLSVAVFFAVFIPLIGLIGKWLYSRSTN
jgi:hypothetical protein